jgi:hypothetical protein
VIVAELRKVPFEQTKRLDQQQSTLPTFTKSCAVGIATGGSAI